MKVSSLVHRWNRAQLVLLPCLLLLATTVPHLEQGDFRRDTGRYAAVGLLMWQDGTFLHPRLNPETPYFDKPPLAFWIHGFFLNTFGVHLPVARAPSILAALGIVVLTVLTARQIGSRAEAIASGAVLALTYDFFRRTREISLDMWQLLFLMTAAYLMVAGAKWRRQGLVVLAGVPIGLALLCKPLVALGLLPLFMVWLIWLGRARWWNRLLFGTLPVALVVALPWHIYMWHQFGEAFLATYFYHETVDRARGLISAGPVGYYLHMLGSTYWPWLLAVAFAVAFRLRTSRAARLPQRDLVLFGGSWAAYGLIWLSVFPSKQVNYLLPVFPMLSWVAAAGLCRIPWAALRAWYRNHLPGLGPAAVLTLVALSAAPIRFQAPPDPDWQAILGWLEAHGVAPEQVAAHNLREDDICYFFLKRGTWLGMVGSSGLGPRERRERTVVLERAGPATEALSLPILFRAGKLELAGIKPAR